MTHIVVLPYPAQGHLPPILHLCRLLAARGILVTLVNVDSIHKQLQSKWKAPGVRLEAIPFEINIPFGYDVSSQENKAEFNRAIIELEGEFESFLERLQPAPSCIIADDFVPWTKLVARKFGLLSISYWPGNAAWSAVHHHLKILLANGDLPAPDPGSKNKLVSNIPGLTPTKVLDLPDYFHDGVKEELEKYSESPYHAKDADWVLVNSFYELEPQTCDAMQQSIGVRYIPVGPLFPLESSRQHSTSLRDEDHDCLKWLDSEEPGSVLYISFGSCSSLSSSEFLEFVHGLVESKQRFLWVMRNDIVDEEKNFKAFERCKKQGFIVGWAPQLKVLSHSSIGGFLTHCGWNSIFESISCGIPMLGWPRHSDQRLNCKLLDEDWKIGVKLQDAAAGGRAQIALMITHFMDKELTRAIRIRVKELQSAARSAAKEGSSRNIESLIAGIRHRGKTLF